MPTIGSRCSLLAARSVWRIGTLSRLLLRALLPDVAPLLETVLSTHALPDRRESMAASSSAADCSDHLYLNVLETFRTRRNVNSLLPENHADQFLVTLRYLPTEGTSTRTDRTPAPLDGLFKTWFKRLGASWTVVLREAVALRDDLHWGKSTCSVTGSISERSLRSRARLG